MGWRIFYDDGSTFGNEDGGPADAPTHGVIAVVAVLEDDGVPRVMHQSDLYWWRDGVWWAGDTFGFLDQAGRFGATWVKQGRSVLPNDYQEIMSRAVALSDDWRG